MSQVANTILYGCFVATEVNLRRVLRLAVLGAFAWLAFAPHSSSASAAQSSAAQSSAASQSGAAGASNLGESSVCFSPVEHCDQKLIEFVSSAEKSLDIAIYDINLDQLVHQILVKSKTIKVRIVADQRQAKGSHSLVSTLLKAGADVRFGHQRGIMHNKFVIVDGKKLETGSFNYTNHASKANNENQIYLAAPEIVHRYKSRFEEIWADARIPKGDFRLPASGE